MRLIWSKKTKFGCSQKWRKWNSRKKIQNNKEEEYVNFNLKENLNRSNKLYEENAERIFNQNFNERQETYLEYSKRCREGYKSEFPNLKFGQINERMLKDYKKLYGANNK